VQLNAPNTFGTWLKNKRLEHHMTQEDFIQQLKDQFGKSFGRSTISGWESGEGNAPIHDRRFVDALAKIFNVRVLDVLIGSGYNIVNEVTLTDKEAVILEAYRRGDFKEAMRLFARD
jgi:transcriptional regulator with XRE-family HTH domain